MTPAQLHLLTAGEAALMGQEQAPDAPLMGAGELAAFTGR